MKNFLANQYESANPELFLNIGNFEPNAHTYYWAACEKKTSKLCLVCKYIYTRI